MCVCMCVCAHAHRKKQCYLLSHFHIVFKPSMRRQENNCSRSSALDATATQRDQLAPEVSSRQTIQEDVDGVIGVSQEKERPRHVTYGLWCWWPDEVVTSEHIKGNDADDVGDRHAHTH